MEKSFNNLRDYIEKKFSDMNNKYDELQGTLAMIPLKSLKKF